MHRKIHFIGNMKNDLNDKILTSDYCKMCTVKKCGNTSSNKAAMAYYTDKQ